MNKIKLLLFSLTLYISGFILTFAKDNSVAMTENIKTFSENIVNNVLSSAGTLLMTAAFIIFMYGIVVFIYQKSTGKGDSNEAKKGKDFMLWGLIALFVMVSAWGIIKLFQEMFSIEGGNIQIEAVSFAPLATTDSKKDESSKNPVEKDKDGVSRENPFAITTVFPVINVGYNNSVFLQKLFTGLKNHKCTNTMTDFGDTYDANESNLVKNFQKENGLTADGVVEKGTWEALAVTTGMTTTFTGIVVKDCNTKDETKKDDTDNKEDFSKYPVLKRGIEFDDNLYAFLKSLTIILYQKNCSTRNFASKANLFDQVTETAVKKFQAANNLNDDGIVGKDTWEALYTETGSKTSGGLVVKDC